MKKTNRMMECKSETVMIHNVILFDGFSSQVGIGKVLLTSDGKQHLIDMIDIEGNHLPAGMYDVKYVGDWRLFVTTKVRM